MPEAPFIQQHATPKISLSVKILINKIWKSLQTFWASHYRPNCSLTRSRPWFTIQRSPKTESPKSLHFWGSPFWDPFCPDPHAICLKTWYTVQNPLLGPCHTISSVRFTIWRGSHFNLFLFGVTFWTPSDGKTYRGDRAHMSKKWSQSKSQASDAGTDMRNFGSVGAACSWIKGASGTINCCCFIAKNFWVAKWSGQNTQKVSSY